MRRLLRSGTVHAILFGMSFFAELKRRNVFRVAAGYSLVAWMLIEAGSVLLPTFGATEQQFRLYTILVITGFLVAVVIAWIFGLTPEGVRRESTIDRDNYRPVTHSNKLLLGLLIAALLVSVAFNISGVRQRLATESTAPSLTSVAVLPFENRSTLAENRYFADGLHDDLVDRLASIDSLRVISSTTVNAYRDSPKTITEIGDELDVAAVVEGSVQRDGDDVLVNVRVFDARDESRIWGESFRRNAGLQSLFELQAEISAQITSELRAAMNDNDAQRIREIPTSNPRAYALYVDASLNLGLRRYDSLLLARQQFAEAVALDPDYARAQTGLAETVMALLMEHRAIAPGEAYAIAEQSIAAALRADPELAEAYAVRGLLRSRQWQRTRTGDLSATAAKDFDLAIAMNSNLANAYVWYADLEEQQGHNPEAINLLLNALLVDPRNRLPYVRLPALYSLNREHQRTTDLLLKAMQLFPDWPMPYEYLAQHLQKLGRLDEAAAWLFELRRISDDPIAGAALFASLEALGLNQQIDRFVDTTLADHPLHSIAVGYRDYFNQDYNAAIAALDSVSGDAIEKEAQIYPLMARASLLRGDAAGARRYLLLASPRLAADATARVDRFTADSALLLAYIDQAAGKDVTALIEQVLEVSNANPRFGLAGHGIRDAQALALLGRHDAAIAALEEAVADGLVSELPFDNWSLQQNPLLAALHGQPELIDLSQRMSNTVARMRENLDRAVEQDDLAALREQTRHEAVSD